MMKVNENENIKGLIRMQVLDACVVALLPRVSQFVRKVSAGKHEFITCKFISVYCAWQSSERWKREQVVDWVMGDSEDWEISGLNWGINGRDWGLVWMSERGHTCTCVFCMRGHYMCIIYIVSVNANIWMLFSLVINCNE